MRCSFCGSHYPFGQKYFSDLSHYVRTGDFVVNLLAEANNVKEHAFANAPEFPTYTSTSYIESAKKLSLLVTNCHNHATISAQSISNSGIGRVTMTNERDHIAEAYHAIVALLESRIISSITRRQLEIFRQHLEQEMAAELNESGDIAAD